MLKGKAILGLLVSLLVIGVAGSAFARGIGTEAGGQIKASPRAQMAAQHFNYDKQQLSLVGTEAGLWQRGFTDKENKADMAAENHVYNQCQLSLVGTEAGYDTQLPGLLQGPC